MINSKIAHEESEQYLTFDEGMRKEFIFRIFQHLSLGGGMCQFEDTVKDYLEQTQQFYKDLVTVYKDSETEEIKVGSLIFQIHKIDGKLNFCIIC